MWTIVSSNEEVLLRILCGKTYKVGRRKADSDLCRTCETVSKSHATLRASEDFDISDPASIPTVFIHDLKSTCGSWVNGVKITPLKDFEVKSSRSLIFGKKEKLQLRYQNLVIAVDLNFPLADYNRITKIAVTLGCHVLPKSSIVSSTKDNCTMFITQKTLPLLSLDFVDSLVQRRTIVSVDYLLAYIDAVKMQGNLPDVEQFLPQVQNFIVNYKCVGLSTLFKSVRFFLLPSSDISLVERCRQLLIATGATVKQLEGDSDLPVRLEANDRIIAFQGAVSMPTRRLLKRNSNRLIGYCEILMAIACGSTEHYTNGASPGLTQCFVHGNDCRMLIQEGSACSSAEVTNTTTKSRLRNSVGHGDDSVSALLDDSSVKREPIFTSTQLDACETLPPPAHALLRPCRGDDEKAPSIAQSSYRTLALGRDPASHTGTRTQVAHKQQPPPVNNTTATNAVNNKATIANSRRRPFNESCTDQPVQSHSSSSTSCEEYGGDTHYKRRRVDDASQARANLQLAPPTPATGSWISTDKNRSIYHRCVDETKQEPRSCDDDHDLENPTQGLAVVKYTDKLIDPNCSLLNMSRLQSALDESRQSNRTNNSRFQTPGASTLTGSRRVNAGQKVFKKVWPLHMVSNDQRIDKTQLVSASQLEKSTMDRDQSEIMEEQPQLQPAGQIENDFSQRHNAFRNFVKF